MSSKRNLFSLNRFVNRDDVDFNNVEDVPSVQQWDLHEDFVGALEYQTKITKFQNVTHLTLFFPDNFGAEETKIHFIGLKGEYHEVWPLFNTDAACCCFCYSNFLSFCFFAFAAEKKPCGDHLRGQSKPR